MPIRVGMRGAEAVSRRLDRALYACTFAVIAAWTWQVGAQASRGVFASDECFHAFASEWLLAHHRLPDAMPELYSGFFYYYHPLLHVIGALWLAAFGRAALHVLPVAFATATLVLLLTGARESRPAFARCAAALLCALSLELTTMACQLYAESLITLLFVAGALLLIEFQRTGRRAIALALGVIVGLALLAKFSGWLLLLLVAVSALANRLRRDRRRAGDLALALAVALAIAAPWLVRNQALFGSALYPAFAPDLDHALYALNRAKFSMPALEFLRSVTETLGPWLGGMTLIAVVRALVARRATVREGLLAFALIGIAVTAFMPMASSRHLDPLIAVLALASSWCVADALARWPGLQRAGIAVLLIAAIFLVAAPPALREDADLPPDLNEAFAAIRQHTPATDTVLSLWTYDTFYYSRRAATWPIPWGQRVRLLPLFTTHDPDQFLEQLTRDRIDALLVPRGAGDPAFDSANYPASFLQCVHDLVARGELRIAWQSDQLELLTRTPRRG